ncbi:MAG: DNA recombination protein RmuC [Bacteroidales bacterium]|nr:DNA recombination protein RmuC [Bacteroidales bacterium]
METYLLIASVVLLIVLLLTSLLKKSGKENVTDRLDELKSTIKEELLETRRENRELNQENRQEINVLFRGLQDTLLKRIAENLILQKEQLDSFSRSLGELSDKLIKNFDSFKETIRTDAKANREELNDGLKSFEDKLGESIKDFNEQMRQKFNDLNTRQAELNKQSKDSIKDIKETIEKQLFAIREDNNTQLNEMRKTVDEKLQTTLEKRLGESFKQVSERLELVHKGLGEMQTLATGVGDLKKVLSNVKTRGILGEYQLGNILEQLLSPEQYAQNVATKKGSQANVEYAIKLPGKMDEGEVWLPIDSKFPIEGYQFLLEAYEGGDAASIAGAQKILLRSIENFAKTISEKYIDPPHTTDFGIMFLPVESLYAEVLRHPGTFEKLQREYRITVTGPTTLSALLNSLQMGFRTLAVQKRSSEVWKVLEGVKTEFGKFSEHLKKVHEQVTRASNSLDTLRSTRANAMERKLRGVQTLEGFEPPKVIELPEPDSMDEKTRNE